MYWLGLQLILKGGREALVRFLLTTFAVAVGVTILLGVFADFHAFQKTSNRPSWESTSGTPVSSTPVSPTDALLWNYSKSIFKGQTIEQLAIASLGANAPLPPGISALPKAGDFYASPALAKLLQTVPKNELGDRFPGRQVGTINKQALSFPNELAIYVGRTIPEMTQLRGTIKVTHIATQAQLQGTTDIYREAFGVGALAVLFPLLILVTTATRLAAARREERYAAMRLIGATPGQINVVASVDAIVGSLAGAIIGSLVFLAIRPLVANISFSGVKFFSEYVTPTIWGYIVMIIGVPVVAALASLISLRRVRISPLGVSRKSAPKKPGMWRLLPLVAGILLFPYAAAHISSSTNSSPLLLMTGFLLIMIGIVLSGPWLTMQVTKVLARFARSASSLLAARRLSDNPKGAFRTISGLVLAVFVGSVVSVLIPALNAAQNPSGKSSLNDVLRVSYELGPESAGLTPAASAELVSKLESYPSTVVTPIYSNPTFLAFVKSSVTADGPDRHTTPNPDVRPPDNSIMSCATIRQMRVLGSCPVGTTAITVDSSDLLSSDNPLFIYKSLPLVTSSSPTSSADPNTLSLVGLLIKSASPGTLEQIRTYLTIYNSTHTTVPEDGAGALSASGVSEPETIGEIAAIRNNDNTNVERAVLAVIALTLITAGCSLAVTVGGSLVERKHPFTLLRVSGVSLGTLYKVILLEAALPLIIASAFAAGIGLGVGIPVIKTLLKTYAPAGVPLHPSAGYYVALGVGLVAALLLVLVTLPVLRNMTKPEDARFE